MLRILLSIVALLSSVAFAEDKRPNILFCLADDWGWPHAGIYGDKVISTPNFDRVAREGMLFSRCFSAAPSCTPSRAAILTGQYPHRLEEGSCLWGHLPKKFPVYPDLLEAAGYHVGLQGKGWGPGNYEAGGYTRNPAGPSFKSFADFMEKRPDGKPFCFWFGSHDPHRPYVEGSGEKQGLTTDKVNLPPYWPDVKDARSDLLDYYAATQRFDRDVGEMLALLEKKGLLENTIIVITGDNGPPFPRCKANLYDGGTRQPLAVRWGSKVKGGQTSDDFINLMDMAPTFLEAAGVEIPKEMTGKSIIGLLTGAEKMGSRKQVFVERERHANVRKGDLGYPARAIRTPEFLFIHNFRPDRWPAGDPEKWVAVGPYGDCDDGLTKRYMLAHTDDPLFALAFGKRVEEELYDLAKDPDQLHNVAADTAYAENKKMLRTELERWMKETADPRATNDDDHWDKYPYYPPSKATK